MANGLHTVLLLRLVMVAVATVVMMSVLLVVLLLLAMREKVPRLGHSGCGFTTIAAMGAS